MPGTRERRRAVRELLGEEAVRSQAELQERLGSLGYDASQPVLSRDLRALRVAKRDGVYELPEEERATPLEALRPLLRSVRPATHFLMVGCEPGAGSAVARALEGEGMGELVGTVTGDDTVLVGLASSAEARRVRQFIEDLLT